MKILITGAGGAAAISVWKSLHTTHDIFMADIDPLAAGLYLVPPENRFIIPRGNAPEFVDALLTLAQTNHIQFLIPTVDIELLPLAKASNQFVNLGIQLPLAPVEALAYCFDKYALLNHLAGHANIPATQILSIKTDMSLFKMPFFAKPRRASGSTGAIIIKTPEQLAGLPLDESYIIQEFLPGDEYSVDIYINQKGIAIGAVPRWRMKIDSGIAVASQTKIMPALAELAINIATKVGIKYVANVQFKKSRDGLFKLLEINPRFSGTMPLTVAAGVDVPQLLIQDMQGVQLPEALIPFKELMVVRYWDEIFMPIQAWENLCPQ